MEYFVDEMPRDCASCKHYHMNCADGYSCSKLRKEIHPNFSEGIGYRHQDCPLQSLTDYTKQVRKEVVEEITQEVKKLIDSKYFKLCNHEYANGYCYGLQYDLAKILNNAGIFKRKRINRTNSHKRINCLKIGINRQKD